MMALSQEGEDEMKEWKLIKEITLEEDMYEVQIDLQGEYSTVRITALDWRAVSKDVTNSVLVVANQIAHPGAYVASLYDSASVDGRAFANMIITSSIGMLEAFHWGGNSANGYDPADIIAQKRAPKFDEKIRTINLRCSNSNQKIMKGAHIEVYARQ